MGEGCAGWFRACAARSLSLFNTLLTRCDPKVHNVFIGFSSRNQSAIVLMLQTSVALPLCALFICSLVCLFVSTRVLKAVRDYLVEGATPGRLD